MPGLPDAGYLLLDTDYWIPVAAVLSLKSRAVDRLKKYYALQLGNPAR